MDRAVTQREEMQNRLEVMHKFMLPGGDSTTRFSFQDIRMTASFKIQLGGHGRSSSGTLTWDLGNSVFSED